MRRSLMSRRRLTRNARWSAKLVYSLQIEQQKRTPHACPNATRHIIAGSKEVQKCTGASDANASRALAGSKHGSLGKQCEGFDQLSRSKRQHQKIDDQTSALPVALDALRSPLPARLAFVEGPRVHSPMDAGARVSSLVQSDALKFEGWTRLQTFSPLVVGERVERELRRCPRARWTRPCVSSVSTSNSRGWRHP